MADRVRVAVERLNAGRLRQLVEEFAPEVVCHTHFLPAEVLGRGRRGGAPHAVVVTDFEVHRFWLCRGAARYFVAREENRVHLAALGAPPESVQVTGIPVHPVFAQPADLEALRRKHQLVPDLPLVLALCGGFGVGPVEELLRSLTSSAARVQIVVVAGRNEALRKRLAREARAAAVPTRILGFTEEMHEWMALAALAITKPGGLTSSEALACGLPLVLANAIPGQETRNATVLYEEGAAISGENPLTIGHRVARLLADPARLAAMRRAAHRLGRPRAAEAVADELLRMV